MLFNPSNFYRAFLKKKNPDAAAELEGRIKPNDNASSMYSSKGLVSVVDQIDAILGRGSIGQEINVA